MGQPDVPCKQESLQSCNTCLSFNSKKLPAAQQGKAFIILSNGFPMSNILLLPVQEQHCDSAHPLGGTGGRSSAVLIAAKYSAWRGNCICCFPAGVRAAVAMEQRVPMCSFGGQRKTGNGWGKGDAWFPFHLHIVGVGAPWLCETWFKWITVC